MACHHITQQVSFTHPRRPNVGRHWEWDEKRTKWKLVWYDDPGGVGKQTVSELKVCPDCAKKFPSPEKKPDDRRVVDARRSANAEYVRKFSPDY